MPIQGLLAQQGEPVSGTTQADDDEEHESTTESGDDGECSEEEDDEGDDEIWGMIRTKQLRTQSIDKKCVY